MKIRNDAEVRLKVTADAGDSKKSIDDLNSKAKETPKHFDTIKNVGAKAFKATAVAVTTTATALGGLVMKSVKMAGELEQNVGGAEAVFKELGNEIKDMQITFKNADGSTAYFKSLEAVSLDAYRTMGLAQSDYLATVNKMGSLMQGAGLDTQKSLQLSSEAMQRAADVASVMGIDVNAAMESIAGAAKGNFTMMDNLGVAMNDTTLNAYALSKGINKSTSEMTNAEKVELAMQMFLEKTQKMAGNYAKENETFAGSFQTLKASVSNFLSGADDIEPVVESLMSFSKILIKSIEEMAPKIIEGIIQLINSVVPEFPKLLNQLLPVIIKGAVDLINGLVSALPKLIPILMNGIIQAIKGISSILPQLISTLAQMLPQIIASLMQGLTEIINQLANMMPTLIPQIVNAILDIIPVLLDNLPLLIQVGIQLLMGIVQGLVTAIPLLVAKLPLIIQSIINTLIGLLPQLILMSPQLIMAIITGLIESIPMLIETAPQIIKGLIDGLFKGLGQFVLVGGKIISSMWNGIKKAIPSLLSKIPGIPKQTLAKLKSGFAKVDNIGKNIMQGLWNGIQGMKAWVINKVKDIGKSVLKGLKGILGIHSPSKEFAIIGKYSIMGYEEGLEDMQRSLDKTLEDTMGLDFLKNGSVSVSSNYGSVATPNVQNQNIISVEANMDVNKFGQVFVKEIKTFSGGSKQSYNY